MKNRSIVRLSLLAVLGAFLATGSLAQADSPLFRDAQDDLHQAMNPDGDAPSVADKTKLVKEALDALKKIPMGGYHGHLKNALTFCESALDVLHQGDPDNKANLYIKEAWEEVRTASN